jgi:hypothetical protein
MRSEEEIRVEFERARKIKRGVFTHPAMKDLYLDTLKWVLNDKGEK